MLTRSDSISIHRRCSDDQLPMVGSKKEKRKRRKKKQTQTFVVIRCRDLDGGIWVVQGEGDELLESPVGEGELVVDQETDESSIWTRLSRWVHGQFGAWGEEDGLDGGGWRGGSAGGEIHGPGFAGL